MSRAASVVGEEFRAWRIQLWRYERLVVANPGFAAQTVKSPVATSQVAATILAALNIDPNALAAVRNEGTQTLLFVVQGNE